MNFHSGMRRAFAHARRRFSQPPTHVSIVNREKRVLTSLLGLTGPHSVLEQTLTHLDELFLIVCVGEFNSGKSQLINALVKHPVSRVGAVPTTAQVVMLRHPDNPVPSSKTVVVASPTSWLAKAHIVDTPGTNAIVAEHQQITEEFIPRADLVLFVTSADRPMTESESSFMRRIAHWRKKVVLVLNKMDLLEAKDRAPVIHFCEDAVERVLGDKPLVFPVSAKASFEGEDTEFGVSGLEHYIDQVLADPVNMSAKLSNPVEIAKTVLQEYRKDVVSPRLVSGQQDREILEEIDQRSADFKRNMESDFVFQLGLVDNVLLRLQNRTDKFIESEFRLSNAKELLSAGEMSKRYQSEVLGGFTEELEKHVGTVGTWVADRTFQHTTSVIEFAATKTTKPSGYPRSQRPEALLGLSKDTQRMSMDQESGTEIAKQMKEAVFKTAAMQVSAAGLAAVASMLSLDLTGFSGAGAVAVAGMLVLPYGRRTARYRHRNTIDALRVQLKATLTTFFEQELQNSAEHTRECLAPLYSSVCKEQEALGRLEAHLGEIDVELSHISLEIKTM